MPSTQVQFVVPGTPIPWARPGQAGGVRFTPGAQRTYGRAVALLARRAMAGKAPFAGAVVVLVEAVFEPPASWSKARREAALMGEIWPAVKPDWDNLGKLICDAMNKIVYADDGQVVDGRVIKRYGSIARVEVAVSGGRE